MSWIPTCLGLTQPAVIETVGSLAAILTTGSFLPQAWLTFRTRNVAGISLGMYAAFTLGVGLWTLYGLALESWPMTVANVVTLTLASGILGMKVRYGRSRPPATGSGA